jgi:putative phage-type endonuclease
MKTLPPIEAESGSDQWYAARRGLLTASRMGDATSFLKNGSPSKDRSNYMMDLVAERLTGVAMTHFVTPQMQWGTDHEKEAISEFENRTGVMVLKAGLVLHPRIPFFGSSPDGFLHLPSVGQYAILEVKCPMTRTFLEWKLAGTVPEQHRLQMLAQMACCGAKEGVFVAYDPRIPAPNNMLIQNMIAEESEIAEVEEQARTFLRQTEEIFERMTSNG